jgi:hypothetical protein
LEEPRQDYRRTFAFSKTSKSCDFSSCDTFDNYYHLSPHICAQVLCAPPACALCLSHKALCQNVKMLCMNKPTEQRLRACDDRLQRLSGIVAAVTSGPTAVGPQDSTDRDRLFTTVSEACLLLQQIARELDPSQEMTTFICSCEKLSNLCNTMETNRLPASRLQ